MAGVFYAFFLIAQITLVNIVVIGILGVWYRKIYVFLQGIRWKYEDWYRTKDFIKFIEEQNKEYETCEIEILYESQGSWIEFQLKEHEKMFEDEIAYRRRLIFGDKKDAAAIEEMKDILEDYKKKRYGE